MASKEKDIKNEMDKFETVQKGRQSDVSLVTTFLSGRALKTFSFPDLQKCHNSKAKLEGQLMENDNVKKVRRIFRVLM